MAQFQLLLIIFAIPAIYSNITDYCHLQSCPHQRHTLCRFPESEVSHRCGRVVNKGLSGYEISRIIRLHNELRLHVYTGLEERGNPGPQPTSNHIQYLEWDEELALIAQRWAEQCIPSKDRCRNVERFPVSQSVSSEISYGGITGLNVEWIVRKWYNEVENFNNTYVKSYRVRFAIDTLTDHYTQMVWGNCTKIGCGAIRYYKGRKTRLLFVCNYGPSGNVDRLPVYTIQE